MPQPRQKRSPRSSEPEASPGRAIHHGQGSSNERPLTIATAQRPNAKLYAVEEMDWPGFVEWLDVGHPASVKECGQYVPATFRGVRNGKTRRTAEDVELRHLVTLDADYAEADFAERCRGLGWRLVAHETYRSTEQDPRWRLIVQPDRDLSPEEYVLVGRAIAARLGAEQFDVTTFQPERFMYRPGRPAGAAMAHVITDGPQAPVAELLEEGRVLAPLKEERQARTLSESYSGPAFGELEPAQRQAIHEHVGRVAQHWAKVLGEAEQWPEGHRDSEGRGWRQLMLEGAWALAKVAAAPWSSLDEEAAGALWETICPAAMLDDPKCQGAWADGIVERALQRDPVEPPPEPRSTAAEDFGAGLGELFDSTPILQHIRQAAHSRGISAPMVLVAVLARVGLLIPPEWKMPPVVGAPAPVNLAYALVGRSSAGKSASGHIAEALLDIPELADMVVGLGSGEGLIDAYLDYEIDKKDPPLVAVPAFLFEADEVETLVRLGQRSGSTLHSFLKTAVSGQRLSTRNATAGGRNRRVKGGTYRLTMTVAVQPEMSAELLRGEADGFPQRFLFVRSHDPGRPRAKDHHPEWPGVLVWERPPQARNVLDWEDESPRAERYIDYPEWIKDVVRVNHDEQQEEDADRGKGHQMLTRLKVAATLAFLHGMADFDELMWSLAGTLLGISEAAIEECKGAIAEEARAEADKKARAAGRAEVIKGAVVDADKAGLSRASDAIRKKLEEAGASGAPWSEVRDAVRADIRKEYAQRARDQLEAAGRIRVEDSTVGKRKGERLWWLR